ncbi:hypothetical protein [Acinetobacter baumannii]|uniref:hypothetical protein n=1 Tax=Acinetobacter baumannii TaxID=470 RepID=UPI0001D3186D|nr:hypothetical protein [Acinetobacter baumannii]ALJ88958.1 hypothetical protein AN415_03058 [Acinetobacter baumannii]EGJ60404.1 hypothetical protein HMPREF0021_01915 [Acinetobacter baumannii 6013150]EGJ63133.1 hypothetical protein HMPREF0020_03359 [Acinetobacter baumannii 6013113]EHU1795025.1 hypothetical protein [Acinetobacter baumannii]EHU2741684.1 hypothetical protein [Acinetobacter baumannii]
MTDLNKEREVNLRFEQDDGFVWAFDGDSQFGTEISHLMMMHADEYNEDELRVICNHAACEIDRLRAELEKAKAQAVPEGFKIVPIELSEEIAERLALERVQKPRPENDPVWVEIAERAYKSNLLAKKWELVREYKILTEASESGAEG